MRTEPADGFFGEDMIVFEGLHRGGFVARGDDKRAVLDGALKGEHDLPITRLLAARNRDHLRPVTFFV